MKKFKNEKINGLISLVENFDKEINELDDKIACLSKAIEILRSENIYSIELNDLLDKFIKENQYVYESKRNTEKSIDCIRDNCNHDWIEFAHDSHHTYYRCNNCGKEERD